MPKTQLVTSHFIIHTQDYHTHVYSKIINISTHLFSNNFLTDHKSFSLRRTSGFISNTLRLRRKRTKNTTQICNKSSITMRNRTTSY